MLSPTCFGRRTDLLQGYVTITRIQTYDLVNKANLVHNLFLVCLLVSTCFGRLCAHHQEKQLCLWVFGIGICYSVWMNVWYGYLVLVFVILYG